MNHAPRLTAPPSSGPSGSNRKSRVSRMTPHFLLTLLEVLLAPGSGVIHTLAVTKGREPRT